MPGILIRTFPWLSQQHPLTAREAKRVPRQIPQIFRKLTDPWTTIGYAALMHGIFFGFAMFSYGHFFSIMPDLLMPFLTPFGTPIAIAILHTILYWAMLIGLCNYTTAIIARDVGTGSWTLLRMASFSGATIISAKLIVVARAWVRVLRTLLILRALALLIVPAAVYLQAQTGDMRTIISFDLLSAAVFLSQPVIDSLLVVSLSASVALLVPDTMLARASAYGLIAVVYGGLNLLGGLWLMFASPLGTFGGLMVPLGHWAPLLAAIVKPLSASEHSTRIVAVALVYGLLPIAISIFALTATYRRAQNTD